MILLLVILIYKHLFTDIIDVNVKQPIDLKIL